MQRKMPFCCVISGVFSLFFTLGDSDCLMNIIWYENSTFQFGQFDLNETKAPILLPYSAGQNLRVTVTNATGTVSVGGKSTNVDVCPLVLTTDVFLSVGADNAMIMTYSNDKENHTVMR